MKARIKRKIQKRPFLYNVGQVFKACDWLTSIQRGNIVWYRYHSFGTITKLNRYENNNLLPIPGSNVYTAGIGGKEIYG